MFGAKFPNVGSSKLELGYIGYGIWCLGLIKDAMTWKNAP